MMIDMIRQMNTYLKNHPKFVRRVQAILIGLFIFLVAFDIYLAVTDQDTISNVIKRATDNGLFVLTYLWGILATNLFITRKGKKLVHEILGTTLVVFIALLIEIFDIGKDITTMCLEMNQPKLAHLISMVFGSLVAVLVWRQDHVS
ncbi:hypothetical protein POV27_17075 [Aureisphaera galaxeae]|uniref:hypothetical protein n=1 Tax=Aureisphaera galaxeae TaxID=1538023 RepID=UPI002350C2F4|nr:hypothetical protein [Aureisphaera galaxeae]MDC8005768.1 hypothetical protein [Aureisphaera galaxeae]